MVKILNLSSPTLEILDRVSNTSIRDILVFLEDEAGSIEFLSSCKDISLLTLAKLEIEKEIQFLIDEQYQDLDD